MIITSRSVQELEDHRFSAERAGEFDRRLPGVTVLIDKPTPAVCC
jgi:hypothetical protein